MCGALAARADSEVISTKMPESMLDAYDFVC